MIKIDDDDANFGKCIDENDEFNNENFDFSS